MDARHQRRNVASGARFRAANERARRAIDAFDPRAGSYQIVCECAVGDCEAALELSREEYEQVREDPRRFAVLPEHVASDIEVLVADRTRYWVIEKVGDGARLEAE